MLSTLEMTYPQSRKCLLPAAGLAALCCLAAFSQSPPTPPAPAEATASLTFEVASVKPAAPPQPGPGGRMMIAGPHGGPGTDDPERLTLPYLSLMGLLTRAYNVRNYQVTGPSWLDSERYEITAKVPPGATKEQANIMLQNLLAERFHLTLHHETKEFTGYELVVGKNGSKLKETSPEDAAIDQSLPSAPFANGPPKPDANGFIPLDRPGMVTMMRMSQKGGMAAHMTARAQPLSRFLDTLGNELKRPVVDKTGLTGKYDFTLEYAPENSGMVMMNGAPPPPPPPGAGQVQAQAAEASDDLEPNLMTAIQQQLGLRLDSKKIQLDVLIIDHADKVPTDN